MITMDKRRRELLDTYWLEIMFFLIGEHADQHAYQVEPSLVNVHNTNETFSGVRGCCQHQNED